MFRLLFVLSLIYVLGSLASSQNNSTTGKASVTGTKQNTCVHQGGCCKDGKDGKDGINGRDGRDGLNGNNGRDGQNGKDGRDGRDGKQGPKGEKGEPAILKEVNNGTKQGQKGERGAPGPKGIPGTCNSQSCPGSSEYLNGFHLFEKVQDLPTQGAESVEHFTIDGSLYLAFANNYGDIKKRKTSSTIYKMDGSTGRFNLYQNLHTRGANDIKYFSFANKHFIAVTNIYDGTYQLDSVIYQWNGKLFAVFQKIITKGGSHSKFFTINGEKYLAITNYYDGSTHSLKSVIYKWSSDKFNKFQEIATEAAAGCDSFVIKNETFIAFANQYSSQQKNSVQSTVFKWSGRHFVKFQSLQTLGADDVKSFKINDHTFLAFANHYSGSSHKTNSFLYKWDGNMFHLFQSIPTLEARTLYPFVINGQTFLGVANAHYDSSKKQYAQSFVYQASGARFIKYQEIPTYGGWDMTAFEYKGHNYLAVANRYKDGKYNIKSDLYKWV